MSVRILVVDDHPVVRQGLRSLLREHPEWEIVDEAEDGVAAVEKAGLTQPDVVILDISMPRMDGLEASRLIRETVPGAEILILTQHDTPQMMREAFNAGARGYVVKSNMVRDLLAALLAVSRHRFFPDPNGGPADDGSGLQSQA
jgi:DNA-binding NarL/FixJ family response regulator